MAEKPTFQQIATEYQYILPLPLPQKPGIRRPETSRAEAPHPVKSGG